MGHLYLGSGKICIMCILGLGKIQAVMVWLCRFWVNPTSFECFFQLFFLWQN